MCIYMYIIYIYIFVYTYQHYSKSCMELPICVPLFIVCKTSHNYVYSNTDVLHIFIVIILEHRRHIIIIRRNGSICIFYIYIYIINPGLLLQYHISEI